MAESRFVYVTYIRTTPEKLWGARIEPDVTLEHGVPRRLHAWFEIDAVEGGTRIRHVEELDLGHGPLGWLHDVVAGKWFARSVVAEVAEIGRLLDRKSVAWG